MAVEGRWQGFPTLAGLSNVWVTAFVTAHLRALPTARSGLADTRRWIAAQQHKDGGWSYGAEVPPDADSTSWCLIALQDSPALPEARRQAAFVFLDSHEGEDGISTYLHQADGGIRSYIRASGDVSVAGWTSAHPDVTAAALLAGWPGDARKARVALAALVGRQSGAGVWDCYWWRGPFYLSSLVLRALDCWNASLPEPRARRLLTALEREQRPSGGYGLGSDPEDDALTTALALDCLQRLAPFGGDSSRKRAEAALKAQQRDDGGWDGGYVLRIPAPGITELGSVGVWSRGTGGGNSFVSDEGGVFATTLSLYALAPRRKVHHRPLADGAPARSDSDVIVVADN